MCSVTVTLESPKGHMQWCSHSGGLGGKDGHTGEVKGYEQQYSHPGESEGHKQWHSHTRKSTVTPYL